MDFQQWLIVAAILGALTGAIVFLFKQLVADKQARISELVEERDYWRGVSLLEHELPSGEHHMALPGGSGRQVSAGTVIIHQEGKAEAEAKDKDDDKNKKPDRTALYVLLIQAGLSILILIGSFLLLVAPTEATVNSLAANLIIFVVGAWMGRGIDYATMQRKG